MSKKYVAKNGAVQHKPSFKEIEQMSEQQEGFCLACGNVQSGCEPDMRKGECESCGASKVYGAEELALMGLCY